MLGNCFFISAAPVLLDSPRSSIVGAWGIIGVIFGVILQTYAIWRFAVFLGKRVMVKKLHPSYSRKIMAFVFLISTFVAQWTIQGVSQGNYVTIYSISGFVMSLFFVSLTLPFFSKTFPSSSFVHAAICRGSSPDNISAVLNLLSEMIAVYAIVLVAYFSFPFLSAEGSRGVVVLAIVGGLIGDIFAAVFGTRWGKTKIFLFKKTSHRTWFGTFGFCVAMAMMSLLTFHVFSPADPKFKFLFWGLPGFLAAVEAASPKSWDNPIVVASGLGLIVFAYFMG